MIECTYKATDAIIQLTCPASPLPPADWSLPLVIGLVLVMLALVNAEIYAARKRRVPEGEWQSFDEESED